MPKTPTARELLKRINRAHAYLEKLEESNYDRELSSRYSEIWSNLEKIRLLLNKQPVRGKSKAFSALITIAGELGVDLSEPTKLEQAISMAEGHASEAIDQIASYDSPIDAYYAYENDMREVLYEEDLPDPGDAYKNIWLKCGFENAADW
jgi:hypothetical protein